jgi:hypothetical protein
MRLRKHDPAQLSLEDHARWWKEAGGWQLRQILFWRWDPIGVNDAFPAACDEYDSYAGPIVARLKEGASEDDLAGFLKQIESEQMGLGAGSPGRRARRRDVAQFIVEWYPASIAGWRRRDPPLV